MDIALKTLMDKVVSKNEHHTVKIIIRNYSSNGTYRISFQMHLKDGKKESRSAKLSLFDKKSERANNSNQITIAYQMRNRLESKVNTDKANNRQATILEKIETDSFVEYFEKIIKEKHQRNYKICLDHFKHFIDDPDINIQSINNEICRGFVKYLKELPSLSKRSANNYLVCFKAVLNIAVADELLQRNPANNLRITYTKVEKTSLTFEQLEKLYGTDCSSPQLKNAFLLSCYTGLRKSDIIALKKEHIVDGRIEIITQKTKSQVKIPLNATSGEIIENQLGLIEKTVDYCRKRSQDFDSNRLFSIQTGGRSTKVLRAWFSSAGIENPESYNYHTSRHTFVTSIIEYAGSIVAAQKLAGHQDIKTTQMYTHPSDAFIAEAISRLPNLKAKSNSTVQ